MNRLRILQLISSGGLYGAENMAIQLSSALNNLNHESIIGIFRNAHRPNNELAEEAQRRGLQVEVIDCGGRVDFRTISTIRERISHGQIDVIHTHGYKANIYGYLAARAVNVRLIATCHNWPGKTIGMRSYAAVDRFFLRQFLGVAAVSKSVKQRLLQSGVPKDRIRVIRNGIDTERFSNGRPILRDLPQLQGKKVVGFVGRLAREKGLEYLLQAAHSIIREDPNVAFVLVGEGSYQNELRELIDKFHLENNVVLLGKRSDLADIYASIDVFVLPSLAEGLPLVILEAMAAGKPVVATRTGGIPQIIENDRTGLLVDAADAPQLTTALNQLLSSPTLREDLGRHGQDRVCKNFSARAMAENYLALYRESGSQQPNDSNEETSEPRASSALRQSIADTPEISIIIPALNEEAVIGRCLKSLAESDFPKSAFEVIVVDNASNDRTIQIAKSFENVLSLRIFSLDKVNISALRNRGAAEAKFRYLAFLDADCIAPREWLHFAAAQLSDSAGIIGGHCGIPENSPWVTRIWYADRQTMKRGNVTYVPAANLLISRRKFIDLGGFDESLETNEECELCQRARNHGLKVTAYPELGVVHLRDPQSVWAFYRKHAWHGKHVFKVFLRNLPGLVNARPVFFGLYTILMILVIAMSVAAVRFTWFGISLALLVLPSVVLGARIAARRQRWKDLPGLVLLHIVYGLGRASAIVNLRNWMVRSPKSTDRVGVTR